MMRKSIHLITSFMMVCSFFLFFGFSEAEILKFKMTDKALPVPPGFIRVTGDTNYTQELGYGWSGGSRVEWRTSNFGSNPGRQIMTGTFPDMITGSWVAPGKFVGTTYVSRQFDFTGELEFTVKVPPGKYGVYLLLGDFYWSYGYMDYLRTPYSVSVNGKEILSCTLTEKEAADIFYAHEYDDYNPGISYWRKYAKPYFDRTTHQFEAVSDGTIRLAVRNIPITMIALWPEAEIAQAEVWLKKLEVEREQSCELKEKLGSVIPPFPATEEQKKQGYLLFTVDYMDDVFPWTVPDEKAIQSELQLFAALNETEPVTFGILPFRDLHDVRVTVGDLKDTAGNIFSSRNSDVQWAKYTECHPPSGSLHYEIRPTILVHRDTSTVYNNVAKQVWLFFSIPPETPPGMYTGDVTVSASNAPSLRKKITLRVLPFRLKTLTELGKYIDLTMSYIYYRHPTIWPGTDKVEMTRKLIKGWADYGFNVGQADFSVISAYGTRDYKLVDGKVVVDFANCEKWLKGWEEAGVTLKGIGFSNMLNAYTQHLIGKKAPGYRATKNEVTTFPPEYDTVYTGLAQAIDRGFAERGWPIPIFFEGGEGGGYEEGRYFEKHVHGLLHKAGVKNSLALSGDFAYFKEIAPLLWAPFDYNFNLERYEWMKEHKTNIFFKAEFKRFERGLYFWRIGALGHHAESYCHVGFGDPYNMFGSPWRAGGLSTPSRDGNGIHPTIELERDVRKGHDDARYLFQLEQLIEEVKGGGTKEHLAVAEKSAEMLEKLREGINPDLEYYRRVGFPSPTIYNKIRWRVAREIIKLNDSLQKQ